MKWWLLSALGLFAGLLFADAPECPKSLNGLSYYIRIKPSSDAIMIFGDLSDEEGVLWHVHGDWVWVNRTIDRVHLTEITEKSMASAYFTGIGHSPYFGTQACLYQTQDGHELAAKLESEANPVMLLDD